MPGYTVSTGAALATSVTEHTQLRVDLLDIDRPLVAPTINSTDVALIVGMMFKRREVVSSRESRFAAPAADSSVEL